MIQDVFDEEKVRHRVIEHTAKEDGKLADEKYDLDARAVAILSKRRQISKNFGFTSLLSFSTCVLVSWEALAITFQAGLINGGPSALVYGLIFSALGSLATAASLAEMSSLAPTSGGQYHWSALFAPTRFAIVASFYSGWITAFSRIAVAASVSFLCGNLVQGLAILNYPDTYVPQLWHGTLTYWAVIAIVLCINVFGIRVFPYIETIFLILHVVFFFMLLVPMVTLAPQSSADYVFRTFENQGGWGSDGVAWFLGLLTATYSFAGIDSASHMSEEVKDAATVVPRAMVWSTIISVVMTFAFSIAILFSIGNASEVLNTKTGYPIIEVFYNATHSLPATNAMVSALVITMFSSALGAFASASRLTWAFARDDGLPWGRFFAYVDPHFGIPLRAIWLITFILVLLGLINLGSTTAFNALLSLVVLGQYSTYILPTSFLLYRRLGKKSVPWGPWQLGKWGVPINIATIGFCIITMVFNCLPPYLPVTAANLNYAPVVYGASLIICTALWFWRGQKHYAGPIKEVMTNGDVRSALLHRKAENKPPILTV